jgi:hypothetical protein
MASRPKPPPKKPGTKPKPPPKVRKPPTPSGKPRKPPRPFTPARPVGKQPYVRRESDAAKIMVHIGMGGPVSEIAADLGISSKLVAQHYKPEIAQGRARFRSKLRVKSGAIALNGDRAMLIFLLKTLLGFKETTALEHTGKDGAPIEVEVEHDWTGFTDAQLAIVEKTGSIRAALDPEAAERSDGTPAKRRGRPRKTPQTADQK